MDEHAAAAECLLERMVDGQGGSRNNVLVVDIRGDTDNPARRGLNVDELHHRIGPTDVVIDGVLAGKHSLRETLADNDDFFALTPIGVIEVAAGEQWNPQSIEETGRDASETRTRDQLTRSGPALVGGKLESGAESAGVAPRHNGPDSDSIDAGQFGNLPNCFFIESIYLIGRATVGHHGNVQRQNVMHIESGARGLQRK